MFWEKKNEHEQVRRPYIRDKENRVVVNMTVKDDSNFLSVFSESETPVISTDVAEFIEQSTHSVFPKEELTLRIHSNCIDEHERELYREGIKEYYSHRQIANKRELWRNNVITVLLTLAGVFILGLQLIFEYKLNNPIWAEVIDIVAWVLLWEAADISIFGNRSLRQKERRYRSYLGMKVEYVELANDERK